METHSNKVGVLKHTEVLSQFKDMPTETSIINSMHPWRGEINSISTRRWIILGYKIRTHLITDNHHGAMMGGGACGR